MARSAKRKNGAPRGGRSAGDRETPDVPPIVGIGASAGGITAFQDFVASVPEKSGIAWVLIQHMAPDRESHLSEILARKTSLPVTEVVRETAVEPDSVYLIAPGRTMTVRGGVLRPVSDSDPYARRSSIDAFFLSLAEDQGEHAGCALLSGAGTDGTIGLKAIKEAGGLTLTQTLGAVEYDSMLLSAVRTGLVDRELLIEEMPAAFADFLIRRRPLVAEQTVADGDRRHICDLLRAVTGHDFSGYKPNTVDRRIRRRMQMLGIGSQPEYIERLEQDKGEATHLFRDMLIGVTKFFRDQDAFAAVRNKVLPSILEGKTADDEVRIWVPGCATGEEVYSFAMMLQEQAATLDSMPVLRVFGSDIDENALHVARLGRYPKGIVADVTPERIDRFFDREDGTFCVRSQLREICLFAQHNALRDPPFSRIDLISCRNVLIYMNADLQARLLPVFHYALRQDGFLFLGPAENASQPTKLFAPVDRKHHIFRRLGEAGRLPSFPIALGDGAGRSRGAGNRAPARPETPDDLSARAARTVLAEFSPAYVVIDADGEILEASGRTGDYLELPRGRPRVNLGAMARSGLAVDVRAAVTRVMATGERETRTDRIVGTGDRRRKVTIVVEPLPGRDGADPLYLVLFREGLPVVEAGNLKNSRDRDDEVARALEQELQSTKERLQSALEELETSNEELKASNEELSSVNEELQSTNEELETSKEELQSINEELRTVNNELSGRVDDLSRANNDLRNLLANTRIAMLFLDERFRIMNFTPPAKPLFHLRDHDVGRPLDELSGQLDHAALKDGVREAMSGGEAVESEVRTGADDDDHRTFIMRVLPYRDAGDRITGAVLTFIDITERKRNEERLATMLAELNHRVKNALASVQAMVHLTRTDATSVAEFAEGIQGRIQAMAATHNLLSERLWENGDLKRIAEGTLVPFADPGSPRLTIFGPEITVRPQVAVTIGMILHELGTNAAKYGAWSVGGGAVTLRWEYRQHDGGGVEIRWIEEGGPPAEEPERPGFGLRFVRQSARYELHGDFRPEFTPEGFRCTISLPADGLRWVPRDGGGEA